MAKLLQITDIYNTTRSFNAKQLVEAACNDSENFIGSFLGELKKLDEIADFDKIADLCAPSCGGNWRKAVIVGGGE